MIFGLFKKNQMADIVFENAKVYTQDADIPWTEAVACKDGKIIYVGNSEDVKEFLGPETEVIDLEGKYMLPGFINTHSHPVLRAFQDAYIPILERHNIDDILEILSGFILDNPEKEAYFAYGFNSKLLKGITQEEASKKLDEISTEKPIMLLSSGEAALWINNCALDQVKATAQEDGVAMITLPYCLQVIAPFDYEEIQNKIIELASEYCSKGFTSVFNVGAPEFMDNIYQDVIITMLQQDMIKQRYFGSLKLERNVKSETVIKKLMQKKTNTMELDDYVHCNTLKIILRTDEGVESIESENLKSILIDASDRGFDIHIDVLDYKAFIICMENITDVRNSGYKKNNFIVACEPELRRDSEGFSLDEMCTDNVFFQTSSNCEPDNEYSSIEGVSSIEEIVDILTIDAAIALGVNGKLGSIEIGKYGDFAIFDENPFDLMKPTLFKKLQADMTVVAGNVVYDVEEDNMQEWYDIMSGMQL